MRDPYRLSQQKKMHLVVYQSWQSLVRQSPIPTKNMLVMSDVIFLFHVAIRKQ